MIDLAQIIEAIPIRVRKQRIGAMGMLQEIGKPVEIRILAAIIAPQIKHMGEPIPKPSHSGECAYTASLEFVVPTGTGSVV